MSLQDYGKECLGSSVSWASDSYLDSGDDFKLPGRLPALGWESAYPSPSASPPTCLLKGMYLCVLSQISK